MPHHSPLIATIVVGLVLAFILGALANRLRISPIVGYLLAGICVGPFTPGFVADTSLAPQLAEIGVILLMFGVGLHFSLDDLLSVKLIAIPGAIVQIAFATLLGMGLGWVLDWPIGAGIVFGLALSVASTVVLLRALQERRLVKTERGKIAVGWLIVEDLAMVLALVLLPALAGIMKGDVTVDTLADPVRAMDLLTALGITLGKVIAFLAIMLAVGRRAIPWLLHYVAHTGSRELFRLSVLAIALGVAYGSAVLFDVSFALGAFFAGMVLAGSELSARAAEETLPLRDAFAVLFFVAVGMLLDPTILVNDFWAVLATFLIIMIGKSIAALVIVLAFRHPLSTALTIAASLAQIGEFSFILATLGVSLDLMPERARDLILAGAILSILANPLAFAALDRLRPWLEAREGQPAPNRAVPSPEVPLGATKLTGHAVVIGCGRVGGVIREALHLQGRPYAVIEENKDIADRLRADGIDTILGPAAPGALIAAANVAGAQWLFIAIPDAFEAGQYAEQARALNPTIRIVARAHSDAEVDHLQKLGADITIMGEREIARAMVLRAFPETRPETGAAQPS
ncbi:MAG: ybaL [Rhodospirillales bacterium]|nr:ybaL [Rhodospirillales bacterium]